MGQKSLSIQEDVKELQTQLEGHPLEYIPPINHYTLDGMYCREMFAHAGTTAVGATHTQAAINMLTEGTCIVTDGGDDMVTLKAPHIFLSSPGKQKIIHFITDCIIVNVFRTDLVNIEELEEALVEEDFSQIQKDAKERVKEI